MSRPRPLEVCDCPRARHEHGTRGMYDRHKCHCVTCQPARVADFRALKPLKHDWADPAPARERLALLRASGLTLDAIAELSGVHVNQVRALLPVRGPKALKKVRADTLAALNSIRAADAASYPVTARSKVDGESARLQLQSLYCRGWSVDSLHERSGLTKSALYGILAGDATTEGFRLKVDALHEELTGHRAPRATEQDRARAARASTKAAANNWTTDTEMAAERLRLGLALAA
jgi:lambda repressor-like predicted transcriptional regulator